MLDHRWIRFGPDGKRTPEHQVWLAIRNKCNNPKTHDYKYYGARGIRVCPRWDSFILFLEDVGVRPSPELTLDRIETNGHYEPGNVRWATRKVQARNRNYCVLDEAKAAEIRRLYGPYKRYDRWRTGVTQAQLAAQFGTSQGHVSQILRGVSWA
jgi:hypothetical protein